MVPYWGIVKDSALSRAVIAASHVSVPGVCRSGSLEYMLRLTASKWESSSCMHPFGKTTPRLPGHEAELQQSGQRNTWAPEPARVRDLVTSLSKILFQPYIYYKCLKYSYMVKTLRFYFTISILRKYPPVLLFVKIKSYS